MLLRGIFFSCRDMDCKVPTDKKKDDIFVWSIGTVRPFRHGENSSPYTLQVKPMPVRYSYQDGSAGPLPTLSPGAGPDVASSSHHSRSPPSPCVLAHANNHC